MQILWNIVNGPESYN